MKSKVAVFLYVIVFSVAYANPLQASDMREQAYTVLDANNYLQIVNESRAKVENLLRVLNSSRKQNLDVQVATIAQELADLPYIYEGATGEGDWQAASPIYKRGGLHIQQNPVYRLDAFDCQSLVQVIMALLYSKNINQFDHNFLKISYGAAGNPNGEIVRYYNRNNFVDADLNPVNQRNGWFTDMTAINVFSTYIAWTDATITRQNWFQFQEKQLDKNVRVLKKTDGQRMVQRFLKVYSRLNFPRFQSEKVSIAYLPKQSLAIRQQNGSYQANQSLFDKIKTPAVVEIVSDAKKWHIRGKNIKDLIGSELNISHLGLVYRQTFHDGELIYHQINCHFSGPHQKACTVVPIVCQKENCTELMFVHATNAYPLNFYWYRRNDNFVCSADRPKRDVQYTYCNRVERIPLFNYLTGYHYGSYWHMNNPAIIGIHIEKLNSNKVTARSFH